MSEDRESTTERDHVGSLQRGLQVMEILAAHPGGLRLTQVADKAGLTRAGARRFLLTLVASGYAEQDERLFKLSSRLIAVARTWITGSSLWSFAEPFMRNVAGSLNESCSAAILADEDVVYVARVAGRRILSVGLHVGTRLPAHCTAMGRVLLAGLDRAQLTEYLEKANLTALTPHTVTDRAKLAAIIENAAEDGFALADEELEVGLRSIAVPIRDSMGTVVAAINVSTQSARFTMQELQETALPRLREAAVAIENFFVAQ